jgi:hypothetical protein
MLEQHQGGVNTLVDQLVIDQQKLKHPDTLQHHTSRTCVRLRQRKLFHLLHLAD